MSFGNFRGSGSLVAAARPIIDGFVMTGQSNAFHPGAGAIGNLAAVPYAYNNYTNSDSGSNFVPLVGKAGTTGGPDYTFGLGLYQLGFQPVLITLCAGSTYSTDWLTGVADGDTLIAFLRSMLPKAKALYPGALWRWHHVRNQGTTDQRSAFLVVHQAWAGNAALWHNRVQDEVRAVFGAAAVVDRFAVQSFTGMSLSYFNNPTAHTSEIASQQLAYLGGNASRRVQVEEAGYYEGDGVHHTDAGYIVLGQRMVTCCAPIIADTDPIADVPLVGGPRRVRLTRQQLTRLLARRR